MKKSIKYAGIGLLLVSFVPMVALAQTQLNSKSYNGTVTSVNGNTIQFTDTKDINYTADATDAKFMRRLGVTMSISDIQNGDKISVKGTINGTNITATSIRDLSLQTRNGVFVGKITSISSPSFVLQTGKNNIKTVNTDSTTVFKKNGQTSTFSDLTTGQTVMISGVWDRTNSNITAKTVNIIVKNLTLKGKVTSVGTNNLVFTAKDGTSYTVDTTNAKFVKRFGAKMTIADIQTGDQISVTGSVNGTNITAKIIRDISLQSLNGMFSGTITAINGSNFTVQTKNRGSQTVNTDSTTIFKKNGQTVSLSDLANSQTVIVRGVWDRVNNNISAKSVNIIKTP